MNDVLEAIFRRLYSSDVTDREFDRAFELYAEDATFEVYSSLFLWANVASTITLTQSQCAVSVACRLYYPWAALHAGPHDNGLWARKDTLADGSTAEISQTNDSTPYPSL